MLNMKIGMLVIEETSLPLEWQYWIFQKKLAHSRGVRTQNKRVGNIILGGSDVTE